ncbi:type IX secretion system periplasmic lipoprotein PorW/SprE [Prevotella sp.]|uniref:type IX secretion system periplasmic lipoprotein PorW/SprE n=1 Tax=Prevotella sp. TaxID=59823 RepID=UPI0025D712AA|nr:tetratricopeptide repeat protein [Prevotella sp.]
MLLAAVLLAATGCSTQKNTAKTRWWHSFKARYNTYYNGTLAYIDGSLEKENGNKDNFTEMLPLYTVGNKQSREIGKGNFEKAIEKCQKTIKLHSIKKRPVWDKKRRKTEKDIEWLSRREYNPFLWKAWMLMGRSQFYKGAFDEAASTFAYMGRLYQTQPAIYAKSRAWLAKCYLEEGWLYDAEDVVRNMERDSIHWSARKEWDYTYADYYIHTGDYAKAIPYLRKVIKHEMRRKQRAREWYLMGQLQAALGNKAEAMRAYKRVIRQNPPYEVEFNARIAMTEVMSGGQWKKMVSRLKRMAASDKNKEYLDQVYYAIGNIYLAQNDTAKAISAYERGAAKATRSGIEKGVLLLKLGDIYWEMERYNDAQRCYGEAIGLLDKERKDYEELSHRSKVLDQLVPYTDAVHLQDSLQTLAKMDEKDRNAAIDRTIAELKRKEKEERDRLAEQNAQETMQQNGGGNNMQQQNNRQQNNTNQQNNGLWYFYNATAVSQGKAAFQKMWGKRENVDNWQRVNKTVVNFGGNQEETELSEAQLDSIARQEAIEDSLAQIADSAQNDPHKREYYLAQIPFTEDQIEASNKIIEDGLFNAGVIFKDKLNNLPLSEKQLKRLTSQYPDFEKMADAYYHMYLLYMRKGETDVAEGYVERLKKEYPESEWTTLLSDPYFVENAKLGVHMEDSLYASTYDAFKAARYAEVSGNVRISDSRFPLGANRDKFVFIGGLSKLNEGNAEGCLEDMNTVVKKWPQSGVAEMAGMIVKGVSEGKRLKGGKFDLDNVWERRSEVLTDNDSTAVRELSDERFAAFTFMIAYKPDSTDENRLLFELARYNFTSFLVRNFDIAVEDADGIHRMKVSGFRNYDEALQYVRQLFTNKTITSLIGRNRTIIISEKNLPLLGRQFSYDDYARFYDKHFAPIKISNEQLLNVPETVTTPKPKDDKREMPEDGSYDLDNPNGSNGSTDTFLDLQDNPTEGKQEDETLIEAPTTGNTVKEESGTTVTMEPTTTVKEEDEPGGTTIMEEPTVKENPTKPNVEQNLIIEEPITEQKPTIKEQKPTVNEQKPAVHEQKPAVKEQPAQKEKPSSKSLEDEFYFGDDPQPATNSGSGSNKKQNNSTDFDDEYYELDGF